MSETRTITLLKGEATATDEAIAFVERFLAESAHCQSFLLTRHLTDPEHVLLLNWEWDSERWLAIAWQQVIAILADAGLEFRVSRPLAPAAVGAQ